MIDSGVSRSSSKGLATIEATIMTNSVAIAVSVTQLPMVMESFSLSLAPKYWDTMIPAPTLIPTNRTISRFRIGPALPTAASALSPT